MTRTGQDICVVAGPGSGKTRVLVERFAALMDQGTPASRILAITFTEKAAAELKQRLLRRFSTRPGALREISQAPVSTIHGFCLSLLKSYSLLAGLDPEFRLFDEIEAYTCQAEALDETLDRFALERKSEFRALAAAWDTSMPQGPLLDVYDAIRAGGGIASLLSPSPPPPQDTGALARLRQVVRDVLAASPPGPRTNDLRLWFDAEAAYPSIPEWLDSFKVAKTGIKKGHPVYDNRDLIQDQLIPAARAAWVTTQFAAERETLRQVLVTFHDAYRAKKRAAAALDFSDLEELTCDLLRTHRDVRRDVAARYDAILMDELQDTNPVQWRLLDQVRRPGRFFAVGDLNQSIYGFRHAEPRLFQQFQQSLETQGVPVDRLDVNYRSKPEILDAVLRLTAGRPGIVPAALVSGRPRSPEQPLPIEVISVESPELEGPAIAARVQELRAARSLSYSDFAVLARNSVVFEDLERAFEQAGVPYVLKRGRNFFDEQEIADLTNWLRVLHNRDDKLAWLGLLRSPFFSWSDDQIYASSLAAESYAFADEYRALRDDLPVDQLLTRIIDDAGYAETLGVRAAANVAKFLAFLRREERQAPGDYPLWLRHIRNLRGLGREPNAPLLETPDAVQIMTIHVAKGLEFPVVILASMHKAGAIGGGTPVLWSPEGGLGALWRPGRADSALLAARAERSRREGEEADRLLYVAMTRAADHLVLSFAGGRQPRGWPKLVLNSLALAPVPVPVPAPAAAPAPPPVAPILPPSPSRLEAPLAARFPEPAAMPVTAAVQFQQCPRRYFLSHVVRWPRPKEGEAVNTGIVVHELLAGKAVPEATPEHLALARRFDESELGRRSQAARRREREYPIAFALEGIVLDGVVDLWFEEDSGARVLVDYKTDFALSESARRAYSLQLQFYAHALAPSEACLFLVRQGRTVRVGLGDEIQRAPELLRELRQAHSQGNFPLREGSQCRHCPYWRAGCPSTIEPEPDPGPDLDPDSSSS